MVVTDVNPEVSRDESEVQSRRKKFFFFFSKQKTIKFFAAGAR